MMQHDSHDPMPVTSLNPPNEYLCPITQKLMEDPVVAADGWSYERCAITQWLKRYPASPLAHRDLTSNHNLRRLIDAFRQNTPGFPDQTIHKQDIVNGIARLEEQAVLPSLANHPNTLMQEQARRRIVFVNAVRSFQEALQSYLNRSPDGTYDPQAAATFTSHVLRAYRKDHIKDFYAHPFNYATPKCFIAVIRRLTSRYPAISWAKDFSEEAKQWEVTLSTCGQIPPPSQHNLCHEEGVETGEGQVTATLKGLSLSY